MTTKQAPQRFPCSTDGSVSFDSFTRIFGTGRCESAGGEQEGRRIELITPQDYEQQPLAETSHYAETPRSASSSILSSANSRSQAERRGFTTMSTPRGTRGHATRKISRTRRRILFLLTAIPSFRGVVKPTRLCSSPLASTKTTKERESFLAPLL